MRWISAHILAPAALAACLVLGVPSTAWAQVAPVSVAPSEATVQSSQRYRIRQGDQITLTVFGEPTLSAVQPIAVLQGGDISLPLIGDVEIAGLTTAQASAAVERKLHRYLRDPQVTVAVYAVGPVEALVLGNVKLPGKYTLPPPARVTDVIAAAGGLGPTDGDLPKARIESPDGSISFVALQALLHDGDTSQNVAIESGTTVYIPSPETFDIRVIGAVDKPGDVTMHEGDDLALAVARAGTSSNANPDLNHVIVTRTSIDGKTTTQTVDLYAIIKGGDLSHDLVMQKNDLVYIPSARRGGLGATGDMLLLLRALI